MNTQLGLLVTVKNTTASALLGVPAGGSKVVFCHPTWTRGKMPEIAAALVAGTLEAYDLSGTKIIAQVAAGRMLSLDTEATQLGIDITAANSAVTKYAHQVGWNIEVAPLVIAAVRADMLATGLASVGVTASQVLAKLQSVCTLVGLGMFEEASLAVLAITPDGYLTNARLSLYSQMLLSANAIA